VLNLRWRFDWLHSLALRLTIVDKPKGRAFLHAL
jgi:hypothetical protein